MKNIIKAIILILIIVINITLAQDKYPSPFKFNYKSKGVQYNNIFLEDSLFQQDKFMLSTQWGGHPRMLKALKMNMNHGSLDTTDPTPELMKYIWADWKGYSRAKGFQYEPTLFIHDTNRGKVISRNHQVFGFSTRLGDTNDISHENYERLSLYSNGSYVNSIVLANSWINNMYYNEIDEDHPEYETFDGSQWNFSINLRRINKNENRKDTSSGRIPVLTIKLPYKLVENDTTVFYIKFNQTSKNINNKELLSFSPDSVTTDTLGYSLLIDTLATNVTEFVIYDDMLPDSLFFVNNKRQDITLNAYFITDGSNLHNKLLKVKNGIRDIDNIDIEVTYHGNTDVAINYLRIATPHGDEFFKGKHHEEYRDRIQKAFNSLQNSGYEIFGIYSNDEFAEEQFSAQRYNNYLMNFQALSEGAGGDHFDHYIEHVEPKPKNTSKQTITLKKRKNTSKIECYTPTLQKR